LCNTDDGAQKKKALRPGVDLDVKFNRQLELIYKYTFYHAMWTFNKKGLATLSSG